MPKPIYWKLLFIIVPIFLIATLIVIVQRNNVRKDQQERSDAGTTRSLEAGIREAYFYTVLDEGNVKCQLCFRFCVIPSGERGLCQVRENIDGRLYTLVYELPSAVHVDPIEKEPQYHHLPGSQILAIGTVGCNFVCLHCHNWTLSQAAPGERRMVYFPAEEVVAFAVENNIANISFTYNDPIVCFEYLLSVARLAYEQNVGLIWHSNGAINPDPLRKILNYTTAITIDLKGFTDEAYANSKAELLPVLESLKIIREENVWLEIVNLVIPTINDNPEDIRRMTRWIVDNLGSDVPVHFSRFFPNFRLTDLPPTPIAALELARSIAIEEGVRFSTIGNVAGHKYNSTFCPGCDYRLIHRVHFEVMYSKIQNGACPNCKEVIPGIWQ